MTTTTTMATPIHTPSRQRSANGRQRSASLDSMLQAEEFERFSARGEADADADANGADASAGAGAYVNGGANGVPTHGWRL